MKILKSILIGLFLMTPFFLKSQESDCSKFFQYFQADDYKNAITSLLDCKKQNELSEDEQVLINYFLQLSYGLSGDSINFDIKLLEQFTTNKSLTKTLPALSGYIILANYYASQSDYERAIDFASNAVGITKQFYGDTHLSYARSLILLANYYMASGDYQNAINISEQALEIHELKQNDYNYMTILNILTECYSYIGDYLKSNDYGEHLLALLKETYGENNLDYAKTMSRLARNYSYLGDYPKSFEMERRALDILKEQVGENHYEYGASLSNLAEYYGFIGKYEKAIEVGSQSLDIIELSVGKINYLYATSLSNLASFYFKLGKYNEALELGEKALELVKKTLGENHLQYPTSLGSVAAYYSHIENFGKAVELTSKALEITKKIAGEEHHVFSTLLEHLGSYYFKLGDYKNAILLQEKALKLIEVNLGKNHPSYAVSLNNLSFYFTSIGNYSKALMFGEEASLIMKQKLGEKHPDYATSLSTLAHRYSAMGNYSRAIDLEQEALKVIEEILGTNHLDYAISLNNIGNYFSQLGNYQEAIRRCERALKIIKDNLGVNHSSYSVILNNLAQHYSSSGNIMKALEFEEQAIEIFTSVFGTDHPDFATLLNNISSYYFEINDYDKSITYAEKALDIRKRLLGENHILYASSLNNLGVIFSEIDNISKATELQTEALKLLEQSIGKYNSNYELTLSNLAKNNLELNKFSLSAKYAKEFLLIRKHLLQSHFLWLTERERTLYLKRINSDEMSIELNSFSYTSDHYIDFVNMSYDVTLLSKGLLLQSSIELNKLIMESGNNEAIEKANELRTIHHTLNRLYEKPISERYLNTDSLETVAQGLERELLATSKEFGDYTRFMNVTWQDVQKNLGVSDVAIEFVEFPVLKSDSIMYAALVLRKDWEHPQMISLFEKKQIEQYLQQSPDKTYSGYVGKQLYNLMWQPLEEIIAPGENIYFSAAGVYHQLALEHLPAEDGIPLYDKYNLHRVSSTRQLAFAPEKQTYREAALYGGIQYDVKPTEMLSESKRYQPDESLYAYRGMSMDSLRGSKWVSLANTVPEVDFISGELNRNNIRATVYTGISANEESFKTLSGKKINMLHLATHGFFLPIEETRKINYFQMLGREDNPAPDLSMRRSGLIMAGGNRAWSGDTIPQGVDDGILTAQEISVLDFRGMDLVVLSACETGLGDINTSEGVFGLQRAFKKAGVNTLIMSLWKVNDEVTKALMNKFYQNLLQGKSKRDSFQDARSFIRLMHPEPRNWGAFIMLD